MPWYYIGLLVLLIVASFCFVLLGFSAFKPVQTKDDLIVLQNQISALQGSQGEVLKEIRTLEQIIWNESGDIKQQIIQLKSAVLTTSPKVPSHPNPHSDQNRKKE